MQNTLKGEIMEFEVGWLTLFSSMSIMSDALTPPKGGKWELTYWP